MALRTLAVAASACASVISTFSGGSVTGGPTLCPPQTTAGPTDGCEGHAPLLSLDGLVVEAMPVEGMVVDPLPMDALPVDALPPVGALVPERGATDETVAGAADAIDAAPEEETVADAQLEVVRSLAPMP